MQHQNKAWSSYFGDSSHKMSPSIVEFPGIASPLCPSPPRFHNRTAAHARVKLRRSPPALNHSCQLYPTDRTAINTSASALMSGPKEKQTFQVPGQHYLVNPFPESTFSERHGIWEATQRETRYYETVSRLPAKPTTIRHAEMLRYINWMVKHSTKRWSDAHIKLRRIWAH